MDYFELVKVYEKLDSTTKKLEKTSIIAEFLKGVPTEDFQIIFPLLQGQIFLESEEQIMGVADKLVIQALTKLGFSRKEVTDKLKETGDLGLVAESLVERKRQATLFKKKLSVEKVFNSIRELAEFEGKGSQDRKQKAILELLSYSSPKEARYIVRTVLEVLRLGVAEGLLRDAISEAFGVEKDLVEYAYNLRTDFGEVAELAKEKGSKGLEKVSLEMGRPIKVMLAEKSTGLEKALEDAKEPAIEVKYDGMRTLIEKEGDKIWLFTRRLENITKQFPDLVKLCRENITAKKAIVEGETMGIEKGKPVPFQELSKRIHRKYEIEKMIKEIPIQINLFDCLLVDGKELLSEKFEVRRKRLEEIIKPISGKFQVAEQLRTKNLSEAEKFYKNALDSGQEGVMVKNLEAPYQPGKRVGYMYKVKPEKESLDLVITGAEWGQGRRANWLATFLLSARDPETGEFLEIGKMGTGLTDSQFKEMTEKLKPLIYQEKGNAAKIKPKIVVEVGYQELQKSPNYSSGFALRFPRLIQIREDKSVEEAETVKRIEMLYKENK